MAALPPLDDEMSTFRQIAKLALAGKPQLLEKLGILKRSSRTAAQRNAGRRRAEKKKEEPEPVKV